MTRADQLREEAETFDRAASFLRDMATAKRAIADQIEKIDAAEAPAGGRKQEPPLRLTGTREDCA